LYLDEFKLTLSEISPALRYAFDQYLMSEYFYLTNTFITNNTTFNEYCSVLFMVLNHFCNRIGYTVTTARIAGYMGELFMGMWLLISGKSPYICRMIKYDKDLSRILYDTAN
jgi:hypothetical protein